MRKRILSLAITLIALLAALSVSASAAVGGSCGDHVSWRLDNGTLTILGTGAMSDYEYGEAPWYESRESITSLVVESGVTYIGTAAFYDCAGLTSVSIPAGVTAIGSDAFWRCTGLTSVNIPAGMLSIGDYAFGLCTGLTSVSIPASVTTVGDYAFRNCTGLVTAGPVVANGYTGLALHDGGWVYVSNGVLDRDYIGLVESGGSRFYVTGGVINWGFSGTVDGYRVENGMVVG